MAFKQAGFSATISYMKALVISDTHVKRTAELEYLGDILRPFLVDVDLIIHAGDSVTQEAVSFFSDLKPTRIVRGNMDTGDLSFVLPEKLIFKFGHFKIGLVHGWGQAIGLKERVFDLFKSDEVDAIIFGHSHQPHIGRMGGVLMLNPGSPTDTRFADRNTVMILEAGEELKAEIVNVP